MGIITIVILRTPLPLCSVTLCNSVPSFTFKNELYIIGLASITVILQALRGVILQITPYIII